MRALLSRILGEVHRHGPVSEVDVPDVDSTRYILEDGTMILEEPIVFQRKFRVGQGLTIHYRHYVVVSDTHKGFRRIVVVKEET